MGVGGPTQQGLSTSPQAAEGPHPRPQVQSWARGPPVALACKRRPRELGGARGQSPEPWARACLTQQEAAVVGGSGDEQRVPSQMSGVGWGLGLQAGRAGCVNVHVWQGLLEPAVHPVGRGRCEGCPSV